MPFTRLGPGGARHLLHTVEAVGQFLDGNVKGGAFVGPFVLLVEQFLDVFVGALQDGAFVLLSAGDDLADVLDAFVDYFATAAFDCGGLAAVTLCDGLA